MTKGGETLLTVKSIASVLEISKRAVLMKAEKESWFYVEGSGNGGVHKRYPLHALPGEIQNKYLALHPPWSAEERGSGAPDATRPALDAPLPLPLSDQTEVSAPAGVPAMRDGVPAPAVRSDASGMVSLREIIPSLAAAANGAADPWQTLPESCRDRGYDILLMVNKVRDLLARAPRKHKVHAIKEYAATAGCDYRSLYRHVKKANKALHAAQRAGEDTIMAQIRALSPQHGKTRNQVRVFDRSSLVYAFSLYTAPGKQLTLRDVYAQTVGMGQAEGWRIGTYESLRHCLRRLDPATATLAREGNHAFEADHLIKILRNYDEIPPNFMWCGDHHIFDVFVKLPDGKGGWQYRRPWLTGWLDVSSRSLMGWCISFAPNSRGIAMALAHGIAPKNDPDFLQCGLPASVYVDRGKDYRSTYLNGRKVEIGRIDYPEIIERFAALGIDPFYIDLSFDPEQQSWVKKHGDRFIEIKGVRVGGVYARLGIGQRYATAYHPWAKLIERFFRNVVQSFSRDLPGWCGSGHEQRPEQLALALKSGRLLAIEEFCERFYGWVVNKYHQDPHRGHGMDGRSPNEVFASILPEPQTCDPLLLDFALLKKDRVKIHNWGFHLNGRQFELDLPVNLQGGHVLNILIGSWATILYDYDYKTVRVYRDGTWYCNARPLNRASYITPSDPVMVDKLKLAIYQKRAAAGQISLIHGDPVCRRAEDEAAALLAITHGAMAELPEPSDGSGALGVAPTDTIAAMLDEGSHAPVEAGETDAASASYDPEDDVIYVTRADRYRNQILRKLARGRELTPEQQAFRESFELSREYLDSQALYETTLEYERYLAGGGKR